MGICSNLARHGGACNSCSGECEEGELMSEKAVAAAQAALCLMGNAYHQMSQESKSSTHC